MSKQYHYVVMYDDRTNKFSIEWDTTQLLLEDDNGTVFDTENMNWISSYDEDVKEDYENIADSLTGILAVMS